MLFTKYMRLMISSKEDMASNNILEKLLRYGWDVIGEWRGNPLYSRGDDRIATVNEHHIYANDIDIELCEILGTIDHMVFISKHSSKANIHSLTVHPLGNFGVAKFGGKDGELTPPAPHRMTNAFRGLYTKISSQGLLREYDVSFEATHHGPFLRTPAYYIEIGSDKECWTDDRAGEVIASCLMNMMESKARYPTALCIGGGHYAPKFSDIARHDDISIGHIVPSWALKDLQENNFRVALEQSSADMLILTEDIPTRLRDDIRSWISRSKQKLITVTEFE